MPSTSIYRSYAESTPLTTTEVETKRQEARQRGSKYWVAIGLAALSSAGIAEAYNHITSPKTKTITETVLPGENPYSAAERAEKRFGKDPAEYNVQKEALHLEHQYGTLHAGDQIKVDVK